MAASAARSTVSLSGCFPNLVMKIPRIQTLSAIVRRSLAQAGSKPKPTASVPAPSVPIEYVASRTFMPSAT